MRGAAGLQAQGMRATQAMRGSFAMLSQNLSGNKKAADQFTVVFAGYVTTFSGTSGSEYALVNSLGARGAKPGDFAVMFTGIGNGVNSAGSVDGTGVTGWTSAQFTWMYDAAYAFKTLAAADCAATDMRYLARAAYPVFLVILRSLVSSSITGTLKTTPPLQNSGAALTFPAVTKDPKSLGQFMIVCDRDVTSIWVPPSGYNTYNYNNASPFAIAAIDLKIPSLYVSGTPIVCAVAGAQTWDQTGLLFELI